MDAFVEDDAGYLAWLLAWLDAHPRGYVINALRIPSPAYLKLHTATCRTIRGKPANGESWTTEYGKFCALNRAELITWGIENVGGRPQPCGLCGG
jgi:hypothetical protein